MGMVAYSFLGFLVVFILIGVSSVLKSKKNTSDYLLAGQGVAPWLAALSAVATNNSGYMFVGLIGFTYTSGLQSVWIMVGWIMGDYIISKFVHRKLRETTEKQNLLSFGGVLGRWYGGNYKKLRIIVGIVSFIFLGIYAAAQFKAGSKALHVLFGWDYSTGAVIGAVIVFIYCLSGGIRASIWTDAAQSFVMITSIGLLYYYGIQEVGGISNLIDKLDAVSPGYLSLMPTGLEVNNWLGVFFFILGWFFAGFGVIGQPHIMIRFMALDDAKNMNKTRRYYYLFYLIFTLLIYGVGLISRVILPASKNFDAELALPLMSQQLLPEFLIGMVLAGLFSATMSTADSQVLSCSAAFTRDIFPGKKDNLMYTKLATGMVTVLALIVALYGGSNVFELVVFSWSVLAAAFAPLLLLYAIGNRVTEKVAIIVVSTGLVVAVLWNLLGLSGIIYEVAPGMISGFIIYYLVRKKSEEI
jgi:SSS family transporter